MREVVDAMLAAAPREKPEKAAKSAALEGAAARRFAAPAAEAALGEAAYVGLFHVHAALLAATHRENRAVRESTLRTFMRQHAFPAAASAASPHVAVAAATHCAAVAPQIQNAALAREAMEALVAALERETFAGGDPDEDPDKDPDEDSDSEASSVAREVASWAARALCLEAPCAEEAFGAPAAYASFAARLAARVEAEPLGERPAAPRARRPRGRGRGRDAAGRARRTREARRGRVRAVRAAGSGGGR